MEPSETRRIWGQNGLTDPGATSRRGRRGGVALERGGAAKEYEPRANVPRRALLPDGRHRRERVSAPAPRPVLLLIHRRVHHRVPRRRPWSRHRARGRGRGGRGRPGLRRGSRRGCRGSLTPGPRPSAAAAAAPRVGVGVGLRRHARVHVHRRHPHHSCFPLGFRELSTKGIPQRARTSSASDNRPP